ncbi:uncharacterized protein LOC62_02G003425 [Vanrija pseudolonga]|uniref:Uncharacterized protein n=1 Tax=Vanrija pseudolonga TaxID=143232 RepID=A0AAF0Y8K5_9TREE|nr:hypothetical protein LOC62_02G003425 [Vanrija pseudolonga]
MDIDDLSHDTSPTPPVQQASTTAPRPDLTVESTYTEIAAWIISDPLLDKMRRKYKALSHAGVTSAASDAILAVAARSAARRGGSVIRAADIHRARLVMRQWRSVHVLRKVAKKAAAKGIVQIPDECCTELTTARNRQIYRTWRSQREAGLPTSRSYMSFIMSLVINEHTWLDHLDSVAHMYAHSESFH